MDCLTICSAQKYINFVKNTLIKFKNKNSNSFPISSYSLLISIERFTCPSANHKNASKNVCKQSNTFWVCFAWVAHFMIYFQEIYNVQKWLLHFNWSLFIHDYANIHNEWVCLHGKRIANLISIIAWKISYLFNGNGNNGFAFLFRILLLVLPIMTVNQSFVWFAACDFEVNLGFSQKSNHGSILTILSFFGITPIISLFFHSLTLSPS